MLDVSGFDCIKASTRAYAELEGPVEESETNAWCLCLYSVYTTTFLVPDPIVHFTSPSDCLPSSPTYLLAYYFVRASCRSLLHFFLCFLSIFAEQAVHESKFHCIHANVCL